MKVFLSWSGERSKSIATALREWLPSVINEVQPFMSSEIDAGARWQSEVSSELESTDFGIICVTSENQDKPWINFEAGALAKSVALGRVVPLAVNLTTAEIRNPLGQFQAQPLAKDGMLRVLLSLNSGAQRTMPQEFIERSLEKWWPDLESEIEKVQREFDQGVSIKNPPRSDRDLLEDILTSVRSLVRQKQDSQTNARSYPTFRKD
ncbi:MAG: toll/interleukin-1 receptor domain-containing protein [Acidobacteria bacterium]|nr:toll/interleukin-1 receptor domain-containing protein [Acidobacteriota bacterium]